MKDAVNWFEIPVHDLDRALAFYNEIFGIEMKVMAFDPENRFAQFPSEPGRVGGCIIHGPDYTPSQDGVVIYLNGGAEYRA